jgi:hypothetical protein
MAHHVHKMGKRWVVRDRKGRIVSSHHSRAHAEASREHRLHSKKELAWRAHQRPGSIMHRKTFEEIERKSKKGHYRNPRAVAGAAYWRTEHAKYRRAQEHHR